MQYSLVTKHLTISELDQQQMEEKLNRLEKLLLVPYHMAIALEHDMHHRKGEVVHCRLNLTQRKKTFYAERSAESMQKALDEAISALRHELEKFHSKHKDHHTGQEPQA